MPKKKMRRTEMYITNSQYEAIKNESDERGITFSEMVRKIIDNYLEKKE